MRSGQLKNMNIHEHGAVFRTPAEGHPVQPVIRHVGHDTCLSVSVRTAKTFEFLKFAQKQT